MAISLRATSTGPNNHSTTTTINLPTGTTTGDFTIIVGSYLNSTAVTPPSGWTTIVNFLGQFAVYRMWQSGDPTSVTFTGANTDWWETVAATYSGVDATTPIDTSNVCFAQQQHWGNSLYNAPAVNPSWNNDLLLAVLWTDSFSGGGTLVPASGFTSRVSSSNGPNVAITDKQLSSAAATGNAVATWLNANLQTTGAAQIALHAAGDTSAAPADPSVTWGAVYANVGLFSGPGTISIPLSALNAQQDDLICIFAVDNNLGGAYPTAPTGYTLQASGNGSFLWTRSYQSGDADPGIVLSATNYSAHAAIALRSVGSASPPVIDQVNSAAGSGSPSTATLSSLTPATATEYLLAWFGQNDTSGGDTWTPPGGLTQRLTSTQGPSALVCDTQPASVPTGTISGTDSQANAIYAIELLVQPGAPPLPPPKILIPAYFYPGATWTELDATTPRGTVVIMNPASGPGLSSDPNYVSAVGAAQAAGMRVIGYIPTNFGAISSATVEGQIDDYKAWYAVDGIFLDQCSAASGDIPYYTTLSAYIKGAPGTYVALNPGTAPDTGYFAIADLIAIFEGTWDTYLGSFTPPVWAATYTDQVAHLIYKTIDLEMANALALARTNDAGVVFVTDEDLPNPWGGLPPYWVNEVTLIGEGSPDPFLLDTLGLTTPIAGYSLGRQLRGAYSGAAFRVRRSSDNTEQDIGFVSGAIDSATLLTFCSATDGFVSKIYDQTANGYDLVQATTADQPQVVSSGSLLNSMNSLPSANNGFMTNSTITLPSSNQDITVIGATVNDGSSGTAFLRWLGFVATGQSLDSQSDLCFALLCNGGSGTDFSHYRNFSQRSHIATTAGTAYIVASRDQDGTNQVWTNELPGNADAYAGTYGTTGALNLHSDASGSELWTGRSGELIVAAVMSDQDFIAAQSSMYAAFISATGAAAQVSQAMMEAIAANPNPPVRVSQALMEAVAQSANPHVRVSQLLVEAVLKNVGTPTGSTSQILIVIT